jgi:hypothetical protein
MKRFLLIAALLAGISTPAYARHLACEITAPDGHFGFLFAFDNESPYLVRATRNDQVLASSGDTHWTWREVRYSGTDGWTRMRSIANPESSILIEPTRFMKPQGQIARLIRGDEIGGTGFCALTNPLYDPD